MTNMTLNPKLIISQYYDSLVNQIDIHTEELLEKVSETHQISSDIFKPGKTYHEMSNDFFVRPDNFVPTYQIDSYTDPYSDKYTYNVSANPLADSVKSIKIREYCQSIRTEMIDELRRAETQTMEYYESIRKDIKSIKRENRTVEKLKKQLFANKYFFIIRVDRIRLEAFEAVANRSWFKIYLFELNFYLDQESQEFLKYSN